MSEPSNLPDLAAVLAEVNRLRAEHGMAPLDALPTGRPRKPSCCPVANALSNGRHAFVVPHPLRGVFFFAEDIEGRNYALPPLLNEFARAFDLGAYPDLIARAFDLGAYPDLIA